MDLARRLILEEVLIRTRAKVKLEKRKHLTLVTEGFEAQNRAILDPHRFKAINCTRRAGKSNGFAREMTWKCQKYPGSRYLYLALTRESAKDILWDVVLDLCDEHDIQVKENKAALTLTFKNGSRIKFAGVDSSEREMKKILGQKLRGVGIDEAGSMTIDMKKLCYQMIRPALVDLGGDLTLLGTCENIPNTFFEQVTEGREPGWSVHKWTAYDNPFMREQWTKEIEDLVRVNPLVQEASWFKTHYLNQWVTDDNLLIIPFKSDRNTFVARDFTRYDAVLAVDLGFSDATAFTVMSYSIHDSKVYCRTSFKERGLDFTDVKNRIHSLERRYPIVKILIDGSNRQGVEEMRRRMNLPLVNAEKGDKAANLKLLRDDMIQGRVLLEGDNCNELIGEWSHLVWEDETKQKEDPRCENHCSDSALYAWRECIHYAWVPEVKPPKETDPEFEQELERREIEALEEQQNPIEEDWLEKVI